MHELNECSRSGASIVEKRSSGCVSKPASIFVLPIAFALCHLPIFYFYLPIACLPAACLLIGRHLLRSSHYCFVFASWEENAAAEQPGFNQISTTESTTSSTTTTTSSSSTSSSTSSHSSTSSVRLKNPPAVLSFVFPSVSTLSAPLDLSPTTPCTNTFPSTPGWLLDMGKWRSSHLRDLRDLYMPEISQGQAGADEKLRCMKMNDPRRCADSYLFSPLTRARTRAPRPPR